MRTTQLASSMMAVAMALTMAGVADADESPELKQVEIALRPVLEKLDLKAEVSYPGGTRSLVVSYRTQPYKIHPGAKSGEVSPDTQNETGPSFKGFVLNVHLQDKGEVNQAVTPQSVRLPYWQTYVDVSPIGGTQKQVYWALSFGSRTDPELLAQLKKALHDLKAAGQAGADQPAAKPAGKIPAKDQPTTPTSEESPR